MGCITSNQSPTAIPWGYAGLPTAWISDIRYACICLEIFCWESLLAFSQFRLNLSCLQSVQLTKRNKVINEYCAHLFVFRLCRMALGEALSWVGNLCALGGCGLGPEVLVHCSTWRPWTAGKRAVPLWRLRGQRPLNVQRVCGYICCIIWSCLYSCTAVAYVDDVYIREDNCQSTVTSPLLSVLYGRREVGGGSHIDVQSCLLRALGCACVYTLYVCVFIIEIKRIKLLFPRTLLLWAFCCTTVYPLLLWG